MNYGKCTNIMLWNFTVPSSKLRKAKILLLRVTCTLYQRYLIPFLVLWSYGMVLAKEW
jgi:hypothetical protein